MHNPYKPNKDKSKTGHKKANKMEENLKKEIVQHITKNLLDIQILTIINKEPAWGYKIKKQIEAFSGLKIRHGALYPLLKKLENKGLIKRQEQKQGKRIKKVYSATEKGRKYVKTYMNILNEQIQG
ncbi:MAG: PadR family transcriptional regulator [Candidatus Bathyarchaeia archaeon]